MGNVIKYKSFEFAIEIVYLYKKLIAEHKEYVMSKQLLKSGTSIGANVREAEFAVGKPDFINNNDHWVKRSKQNGLLVGFAQSNGVYKYTEVRTTQTKNRRNTEIIGQYSKNFKRIIINFSLFFFN